MGSDRSTTWKKEKKKKCNSPLWHWAQGSKQVLGRIWSFCTLQQARAILRSWSAANWKIHTCSLTPHEAQIQGFLGNQQHSNSQKLALTIPGRAPLLQHRCLSRGLSPAICFNTHVISYSSDLGRVKIKSAHQITAVLLGNRPADCMGL